jgi:biopolymer transport protein TolQ
MSIFSQAFFEADPFGKLIFFSLFLLSLWTWYVLFYKGSYFRSLEKNNASFSSLFEAEQGNILDLELTPNTKSSFSLLYFALKNRVIETLDKKRFFALNPIPFLSKEDIDLIEAEAQSLIIKEKKQAEKKLFLLAIFITLAPFLGILGTVWGILQSLFEMQKGAAFLSQSALMAGLSTALATTVLGLVIAIPALISHGVFKSRCRSLAIDMHCFAQQLISQIELSYRKVEG